MKTTVVGKPESFETTATGAIKAVIRVQYEKSPAFPKGVPPLSSEPFMVTAFVSPKQWKKIESALSDPEDRLIFEGQATVDFAQGMVLLHCTNINSIKLQQAGREPKESAPEKAENSAS